jgi:IS605 OrfB family transposase
MILTYSYRIKESDCADVLATLAKSVNVVWNFCNESQLHALKWNKPWPNYSLLCELTASSSKDLGLHSQTVQAVCQEYDTRRRQAKKRKLRWRGKRSLGWIPFKAAGIKVQADTVIYCGRPFRFWLSRPLGGSIKSGSFSQDARGRWYLNFQCETEQQLIGGAGEEGIDLGLKTLTTCASGKKYENQRVFHQWENRLAYAQRSRRKRLAKTIHAKIKNTRKDFNHKISHELTRDNRLIVVGNVGVKGLMKTQMAKSVADAGWSQLRTFLEYKAMARGGVYLEVNEAFTTQDCSACGARGGPQGREELGVREWMCSDCHTVHDRDVNSAINILHLGHQVLLLKCSRNPTS